MMLTTICPTCRYVYYLSCEAGVQTVQCPGCRSDFQVLAEEGFQVAEGWANPATATHPGPAPLGSGKPEPKAKPLAWIPKLVRNVFCDADRERTRRFHQAFRLVVGVWWLGTFLRLLLSSRSWSLLDDVCLPIV